MTPVKKQFGQSNVLIHQLETPNQGNIALTQLVIPEQQKRASIVMMPGMFSNRRFWLSDKGIGLAAYLAQHGYECWMMDRRGQGESGKEHNEEHSLINTLRSDLPAIQVLLKQHGIDKAFYMGHSFGGVLNGISVAKGYLEPSGVSGLINFSSQLTVGKTLLNRPYSAIIYALTGLLGYFPAKRLGMGPENESKQAMRDCCRIVDWAKGRDRDLFWSAMQTITCPVLAFGSEGDTVDPSAGCKAFVDPMSSTDKTFTHLAKKHGHKKDYDHVGMIVSKDAQQEVWPMLKSWLEQRT